jgi:hypothetical protein
VVGSAETLVGSAERRSRNQVRVTPRARRGGRREHRTDQQSMTAYRLVTALVPMNTTREFLIRHRVVAAIRYAAIPHHVEPWWCWAALPACHVRPFWLPVVEIIQSAGEGLSQSGNVGIQALECCTWRFFLRI